MCGIVGVCGEPVEADRFERAVHVLSHRGPDGWGVFRDGAVSLGHRRLSVIDLSDGGRQPMKSASGDAVLVFNGEIYNYVELRDELTQAGYVFHTQSDTEVLLYALQHHGLSALSRLNGMWAFALWRPDEQKLYFSRDRFGVKPFYYLADTQRFAFASEPKSLTTLYPGYRSVNEEALYRFLAEGNLYGHGESFYEGIKVLPAAHYGVYDLKNGHLSINRYWDYPEEVLDSANPVAAAEEFCELFDDAVRLRLRSDVEVGSTLSGGLDSTSILAATHALGHGNLKCFTSSYEDHEAGETAWAELAVKQGGNRLLCVEATKDAWLETLPRIAWHMDGPGYSPAVFPLWELMRVARVEGVPVMLEGQGADELLGGYIAHGVANLTGLVANAIRGGRGAHWSDVLRAWRGMMMSYPTKMTLQRIGAELFPIALPYYRKWRGGLGVLRQDFAHQFSQARSGDARRWSASGGDRATGRLRHDHEYAVLPGLLHYGDAISMAHGIESRHPFLDYRLVEWGFRQPASIKFQQGQTKWPERAYLRKRGWSRFGDRWDKRGYPTPTGAWMREDNGKSLKNILAGSDTRVAEYCEPARVGRLIDKYLSGVGGTENHLYRLISVETWLQSCF